MNRARILVADDHPLILDGIHAVLAPYFDCIGLVRDGRALVESALVLKPDLIVLDIRMPGLDGMEAAAQIRKAQPSVKLLFVTMHSSAAYLNAALALGATGYVLKSAISEELLKAVDAVLAGRMYITPAVTFKTGAHSSGAPAQSFQLSRRQSEILQLIARGKAAKEVAFALSISVKTVGFHLQNIKQKTGLRSTAELTRYAIDEGLI